MNYKKIISILLVPLLLFSLALPAYADGTGETYLIYFETSGGVGGPVISSTNLEGKLTSLPIPTMDGYTFEGWYTDELEGDRITVSTEFTTDSTIYAHWRPIAKGSSSTPSTPAPAPTDVEDFSFKAHAGTFLFAGTVIITLVAHYAR